MKQIKTTTVKMTADVEVIPLNAVLVARIARVQTIIDINLQVLHEMSVNYHMDDELDEMVCLIDDLYKALTGEDKTPEHHCEADYED